MICLGFVIWCLVIPLGGCGDITNEIASLEISPSTVTVGINQTQSFNAIAKDSLGQFVSGTTVSWSVTGGIGSISSAGIFTAGSIEGTGQVVASAGGLSKSADVSTTTKGWLRGNVTDTNFNLVIGIRVYLADNPALGDNTDSSGNYLISTIPPGTYEVSIDARNNTSAGSAEVTIPPGRTITQNFQLFTPTTVTTSTTLF